MPKQPTPSSLAAIKTAFETLQIIKGKTEIPFWELAKELGTLKIPLYNLMLANPKLFVIGPFIKKKEKRTRNDNLTENLTGAKYTIDIQEEDKGIHVFEVYLHERDNPANPEYVEHKIKSAQKQLLITRWEEPRNSANKGMMIMEDLPDNDTVFHESKWRNTWEKVNRVRGYFKIYCASFPGKRKPYEFDDAWIITDSQIEILKQNGWEVEYVNYFENGPAPQPD